MYLEDGAKLGAVEVRADANPTIREQIERRLIDLDRQESELRAVLVLLDENPSFEKIHNAVSKLSLRSILR